MSAVSNSPATGDAPQGASSQMVWDPLVRSSHWLTALGCILNLFVLDGSGRAHLAVGYAIAGLLLMRCIWGFAGSQHARFSDFFPWPSVLVPYVKELALGRERRYIGHNPAGAVMMLALLLVLGALSVTGWMQGLDMFWGMEWLQNLHGLFANALFGLALIHAGAAVFESWRHSENLVLSMITGRKRT